MHDTHLRDILSIFLEASKIMLLGRSYIETNEALACQTFCNAATKHFDQIILYCVVVSKTAALLQLHRVATTRESISVEIRAGC